MHNTDTQTGNEIAKDRQGLLIVFEGIDGTGKSTQVHLLAEALERRGYDVVTTREPTSGKYGQKIRTLFSSRNTVSPEEELRLFLEDRREHVDQVINPALARGKIVITDRYYFSTAAYQGAAGHDVETILAANEKFAPEPDLVLLLLLSPSESISRIENNRKETLNDFEQEAELRKVAEIFLGIRRDFIVRIKASGTPETVHAEIINIVGKVLKNKGFAHS